MNVRNHTPQSPRLENRYPNIPAMREAERSTNSRPEVQLRPLAIREAGPTLSGRLHIVCSSLVCANPPNRQGIGARYEWSRCQPRNRRRADVVAAGDVGKRLALVAALDRLALLVIGELERPAHFLPAPRPVPRP